MAAKIPDLGSIRSQVVTVRLDPKLKYLAELGARKQRRALSSFIEWAVESSLDKVFLHEANRSYDSNDSNVSVNEAEKLHSLYDTDEEDRLAKLGLHFPELLTHDEQVVWKLIRECGALWRGAYDGPGKKFTWECKPSTLNWEVLRENWPIFVKVAKGQAGLPELPGWAKYPTESKSLPSPSSPPKKPVANPDAFDDDIPF